MKRVIWIVLDSVGAGYLPDAADFGDEGANTLGHIAERMVVSAVGEVHASGRLDTERRRDETGHRLFLGVGYQAERKEKRQGYVFHDQVREPKHDLVARHALGFLCKQMEMRLVCVTSGDLAVDHVDVAVLEPLGLFGM